MWVKDGQERESPNILLQESPNIQQQKPPNILLTEKRRGDFHVKSCHGVIAVYPLSATRPFSGHPVSRLVVIRNGR